MGSSSPACMHVTAAMLHNKKQKLVAYIDISLACFIIRVKVPIQCMGKCYCIAAPCIDHCNDNYKMNMHLYLRVSANLNIGHNDEIHSSKLLVLSSAAVQRLRNWDYPVPGEITQNVVLFINLYM